MGIIANKALNDTRIHHCGERQHRMVERSFQSRLPRKRMQRKTREKRVDAGSLPSPIKTRQEVINEPKASSSKGVVLRQ